MRSRGGIYRGEFFSQQLDKHFADFARELRADNKIRDMQQGDRQPRDFLADFDRTLHESSYCHSSDDMKIMFLDEAISSELFDITIPLRVQGKEPTYEEIISRLRRSTDRRAAMRAALVGQSPKRRHPSPGARSTLTGSMGSNRIAKRSKSRATRLSQDEYYRRRREGLCISCGESGHYQRYCPYD